MMLRRSLAFTIAALAIASGAIACSSSGNLLSDAGADVTPSGPLYLSSLSVSVTDVTPAVSLLVPPFSPDIHDYYVRCAEGTNALTVSMTASAGAQTELLQPTGSGTKTPQTLALSVQENQAIVAAATDGTATNEYWIRCLPHDFPTMQMDAFPEAGAPVPGYYMVGNEQTITAGGVSWAIVLDIHGVPVWYDRVPLNGVFDVDSVVPGTISFESYPGSSAFEIHQLSPFQVTFITPKGVVPLDNHELRYLPNGDFLVFSDQVENGVDLKGYCIQTGSGCEPLAPVGSILPCNIYEFEPTTGKVVWEWVGTDHFDPVRESTYQRPGPTDAFGSDGGPVEDPIHCNSIDIDPANGNLLVSARNMDSVFYIERATNKILWRMGGISYSKDGAPWFPVSDPFHEQHDARFLPGWSQDCGGKGQISVFDDETQIGAPARAAVYDVNVGQGEGCGTPGASLAWMSEGTAPSEYMGSFRILPDGSRTIGWGFGGELGRVFTEVDSNGNELLDFHFTDTSSSYRSIKVPLSGLDLGLMRSTAGLP